MRAFRVRPGEITLLLERLQTGDDSAAERLLPLVYRDLRRLAASRMAREAPGQTLQPTALVHEAWLRLGADRQPAWANQAQSFLAAAEAMRRIFIDRARRRLSQRKGSGCEHVALDQIDLTTAAEDSSILLVNDALEKFALEEPQKAELVRLLFCRPHARGNSRRARHR